MLPGWTGFTRAKICAHTASPEKAVPLDCLSQGARFSRTVQRASRSAGTSSLLCRKGFLKGAVQIGQPAGVGKSRLIFGLSCVTMVLGFGTMVRGHRLAGEKPGGLGKAVNPSNRQANGAAGSPIMPGCGLCAGWRETFRENPCACLAYSGGGFRGASHTSAWRTVPKMRRTGGLIEVIY